MQLVKYFSNIKQKFLWFPGQLKRGSRTHELFICPPVLLWLYILLYLTLEVLQQNNLHTKWWLYIKFFYYKEWPFYKYFWQMWPPTNSVSVNTWDVQCLILSFSSTTPWQHIRRRFPLSGVWSVSNTLSVTHSHAFVDAQKWPDTQTDWMQHLRPRGQNVCKHTRHRCAHELTENIEVWWAHVVRLFVCPSTGWQEESCLKIS